jgi:hypothetical protein
MPEGLNDREHKKFVDVAGNPVVRVANADGSAGGGGGTSMVDDTPFTPAASSLTPIGALADEAAPDLVDEGDVGALRMTLRRALHVNLRDAAGNELAPGGGVEYTEGDTDPTITGKALLWEDAADTLRPVSAATPLPVHVQASALPAGAATQATLANLDAALGAAADPEAPANGSVIALLKRLRTLLSGGLPAALTAGGNLKTALLEALPAGTNTIGAVGIATQPGAASIAHGQVTVDTTAGGVQLVAARASRRAVTIVNLGPTDVYLGAGAVTTANGLLLLGTKGAALTLLTAAQVKAVVGAGSQAVAYLEEYD